MITSLLTILLTITLQWNAPTTNVDGSPLTDLGGYRVCTANVTIPDDKGTADCTYDIPSTTTPSLVTSAPLACDGTCFYRVYAYDTTGNESTLSNEVSVNTIAPAAVTIIIQSVNP